MLHRCDLSLFLFHLSLDLVSVFIFGSLASSIQSSSEHGIQVLLLLLSFVVHKSFNVPETFLMSGEQSVALVIVELIRLINLFDHLILSSARILIVDCVG